VLLATYLRHRVRLIAPVQLFDLTRVYERSSPHDVGQYESRFLDFGISLSGTGISDTYSIGIPFYFNNVNFNASWDGYLRIIDFKNRAVIPASTR
jgi:hypothetical protein